MDLIHVTTNWEHPTAYGQSPWAITVAEYDWDTVPEIARDWHDLRHWLDNARHGDILVYGGVWAVRGLSIGTLNYGTAVWFESQPATTIPGPLRPVARVSTKWNWPMHQAGKRRPANGYEARDGAVWLGWRVGTVTRWD